MEVFISWSKPDSLAPATALAEWLPLVLEMDTWLSSKDITGGSNWAAEVHRALKTATAGIVIVTRQNHCEPWLLFETGALLRSSAGIFPVLWDLAWGELVGPLSHLQAHSLDREGVLNVVVSINELSPRPLRNEVLLRRFELAWPKLLQLLGDAASEISSKSTLRATDGTPRIPWTSIPIEELRQFVAKLVGRHTLRGVAAMAGISKSTVAAFVRNAECAPSPHTRSRIAKLYLMASLPSSAPN
jgi:hypothetical protein